MHRSPTNGDLIGQILPLLGVCFLWNVFLKITEVGSKNFVQLFPTEKVVNKF
jgi:hypothetical protein